MSHKSTVKRSALQEMSLNSKPSSLPDDVGLYCRKPTEWMPKVMAQRQKLGSLEETKLRRFFKCTKFNLRSGVKSGIQCFACKNDETNFERHLKTRHSNEKFFCCYCYPRVTDSSQEIKSEDYMNGKDLIRHMISSHSNRRYQCNLCLYRSISPEHVDIHQKKIHPDVYRSTVQCKIQDKKFCRIIECPPPTRMTGGRVPAPTQHYSSRRHSRVNNDPSKANNYQCVYCDFLNSSLDQVIDHCAHSHPDYHILFYKPYHSVEVTSTDPNPHQQLIDIDLFAQNNNETQDCRVSSTETPKEFDSVKELSKEIKKNRAYVEEFAFKKKERVSTVQTKDQQRISGLSSTNLNKERTYVNNRRPGPASRVRNLAVIPSSKMGAKRLNQPNRPFAQSSNQMRRDQERLKQSVNQKKRSYESEDSDEEQNKPPPKKLVKPSTSGSVRSISSKQFYDKEKQKKQTIGLPDLISPAKKHRREMACQTCTGNVQFFTEDHVESHLKMFHKKYNPSKTPFICGYCKEFGDSESDFKVIMHQNECPKKPKGSGELIEKLIVSKLEFERNMKLKAREEAMKKADQMKKEREMGSKPSKRRFQKKELNYLSSGEEEEVEESLSNRSGNRKPADRHSKLVSKKINETKTKFNQLKKSREQKNLSTKPDETTHRKNSISSLRYQSTDSERSGERDSPIVQFESSDEEPSRPQPSTSKTTIKRATPDRESDSYDEQPFYVCFFCDEGFSENKRAISHMDSHIPELEDIHEVKIVNKWVKKFIRNQFDGENGFEPEKDYLSDDPHYRCPLCVKIGRGKGLPPKRFKHFWEAKAHLWEHSKWKPIKCTVPNEDDENTVCGEKLANNDHIIARHLNTNHYEVLDNSENDFIIALRGNKAKDDFTEHTREALIIHELISEENSSREQVIEKHIEHMLRMMIEDRESQLRAHTENQYRLAHERDISVTLPEVRIEKLPPLNFEDSHMIYQYLMDLETAGSRVAPKQSSSGLNRIVNKVETLDIASSSDDELLPINITRKRNPSPSIDILGDDEDDIEVDLEREKELLAVRDDESNSGQSEDKFDEVLKIEKQIEKEKNQRKSNSKSNDCSFGSQECEPSSDPKGRYRCSYCSKKYITNKEIRIHIELSHPDQAILFQRVTDDV